MIKSCLSLRRNQPNYARQKTVLEKFSDIYACSVCEASVLIYTATCCVYHLTEGTNPPQNMNKRPNHMMLCDLYMTIKSVWFGANRKIRFPQDKNKFGRYKHSEGQEAANCKRQTFAVTLLTVSSGQEKKSVWSYKLRYG